MEQARAPAVVEGGKRAFILAERLFALTFRFGVDQVGQRLGLGQVEFAVLDRPSGEFARLGGSQARDPPQRAQHGLDHGAAAMDMEFGDILARKARPAGNHTTSA
jgi:hypothetical protein